MLIFNIPSLRPKPVVQKPVADVVAVTFDNQEKQWLQRDTIIKVEFRKRDYEIGDLVRPVGEKEFKDHGYGKIRGIVSCYKDWPKNVPFPEAPKLPMITLVEPHHNDGVAYTCSVNYVRKLTEDELAALDIFDKL